jgi:type III restriction enzyme
VIAPNIIVLDHLRADFDGLRIFFNDPVLPDNGMTGQNWRDDFQLALHMQDDVRIVTPDRQYLPDQHPPRLSRRRAPPSLDDDDLRITSWAVRRKAGRQDHRQQDRPGR